MQEIEVADCLSFSSYSSSTISVEDIASKVINEECTTDRYEDEFGFHPDGGNTNGQEGSDGHEDKDDFEFASVNFTNTTKPIFPIFNKDIANFEDDPSCPRLRLQRLFVKELSSLSSSSSSSSSETDVDCIWAPKSFTTTPDRTYCPKKSKSYGRFKTLAMRYYKLLQGLIEWKLL